MILKAACVVLTWAIALVSAAPNITIIDLPTANSLPCDMALGGDNNIYTLSPAHKLLIRINTATGTVTNFPLPRGEKGNVPPPPSGTPVAATYLPCAVRADPRGNIYAITGYNLAVAKFDPQTETMTDVPIASALSDQTAWSNLWPALDNIYLTNTNGSKIVAVNYTSGYRIYDISGGFPTPFYCAAGLWLVNRHSLFYTFPAYGNIYRLNLNTGKSTITATTNSPGGPINEPEPCYIRAESDGLLYIVDSQASFLTTINATTGKMVQPIAAFLPGLPSAETVDGAGKVWWTASYGYHALLGYVDPGTPQEQDQVTSVALPGQGTSKTTNSTVLFLIGVQYVKSLNRIYFAQPDFNRVGYVDVSTVY